MALLIFGTLLSLLIPLAVGLWTLRILRWVWGVIVNDPAPPRVRGRFFGWLGL